MDWYYAENDQRIGPISEDRLVQLANEGAVGAGTLVWHSGMTEWKSFREARPGTPPPIPTGDPGPKRFCNSCGREYPLADLAIFGESAICASCKPEWVQRLRQGMASTTPITLRYAGFWIRVGASLIDGVIFGVVFGFLAVLGLAGNFAQLLRSGNPTTDEINAFIAPFFAVFQLGSFLFTLAFYVFFWSKFGATPGKMALGLKVVTPQGGPISIGQAFGRFFGTYLSSIILGIGYLMVAWDDQKRALHDRLADTRVIHTR
jgi:uncharacterized RDD family membrane protein YckC